VGKIVTKAELARARHVSAAAVSAWLRRGKLTAPALLPDGRIDYDVAIDQLRERLDPARSRTEVPDGDAPARSNLAVLTERQREQRVEENDLKLRRLKREELERAGALTDTDAVAKAHARHYEELLAAIEQWVPELAVKLGADRDGVALARREWRGFRDRQAQAAEARTAGLPSLVAAPNAH
jgi:hypothetical protein